MLSRRVVLLVASPLIVGLLSSCGYVHVGRLPAPAATPIVADERLARENTDLRLEKKLLQQELALTRAQGEALRRAIENRAADGDTSRRLTERLNETTRDLAALRADYAQLQQDRDAAVASAAESHSLRDRLAVTEEKLAASLQASSALEQEVAQLRREVDRTRAENLALGEQVKSLHAQNAEALAAIAALNTDLLSQKDARIRAEQDADTLRTQLARVDPGASLLAQQRTGAAAEARSLAAEHAAEIAALKRQLDASHAQLDTLENERTRLQAQLASVQDVTEDNTQLRDENESLKAASAQLQATKAELETQLARLRHGTSSQHVQVLREQLQSTQAQAAALVDENARLKARVAGGTVANNRSAPIRVSLGGAADPTTPESISDATPPEPAPVASPAVESTSSVIATLVTRAPGSQPSPAPRIELPGRGRVHVVAGGDTLSKISARYYGTPSRWDDILAANRDILGETNNLVIGRALRIP